MKGQRKGPRNGPEAPELFGMKCFFHKDVHRTDSSHRALVELTNASNPKGFVYIVDKGGTLRMMQYCIASHYEETLIENSNTKEYLTVGFTNTRIPMITVGLEYNKIDGSQT